MTKRHSIAETESYRAFAEKHLSDKEREDIIETLSATPDIGDIVPNTGGIRKVRFAAKGKGKSGGVRIITFYLNDRLPVYLLAGFSKNERINISEAEKKEFRRLTSKLKKIAKAKGDQND